VCACLVVSLYSVPRPLPSGAGSANDYHLRVEMYEYLGKLMGLAVRTQGYMPFDLPSIVWKALVSADITTDDVRAIDLLSFKILDDIRTRTDPATGDAAEPALFDQVFADVRFQVYGSDARLVDLIPGGARTPLTWANRKHFTDALIRYRLTEFAPQCEAIRRGLACVLPYKLLPLLTWQEMGTLVLTHFVAVPCWLLRSVPSLVKRLTPSVLTPAFGACRDVGVRQ
jgi:E3 ubiquitin-protein ligase HERC2